MTTEKAPAPEVVRLAENFIDADPAQTVLRLRKTNPEVDAAAVATLAACWRKAREKLPLFYEKRLPLTPTALEQSTSEAAARLKFGFAGQTAADLTCGLGVDALHWSRSFETVFAIELNPELAALTAANLSQLAPNVQVICEDGTEWLKKTETLFDLLYIDPSRRTNGKRLWALEDLEPNPLAQQTFWLQKAKTVLIKLSPLFSLAEAPRRFQNLKRILALSVENECKEVLVELTANFPPHSPPKTVLRSLWQNQIYETNAPLNAPPLPPALLNERYLYEPDSVFYLAQNLEAFAAAYLPHARATGRLGYLAANEPPNRLPARVYEVETTLTVNALERYLKQNRIKAAHVACRNFPVRADEMRRRLKLTEAAFPTLAFTQTAAGQNVVWVAKRIL